LKVPPLERRQRHQRPVQIEKCRYSSALLLYLINLIYFLYLYWSLHTASCETLFTRPGPTLPAMYFQPSTSTGKPRTRQNAAVTHVKTCAPTRMVACASAASSPTSATGPRVSA